MLTSKFKWMRLGLVMLSMLLALAPLGQLRQASAASAGPRVGIVCDTSPSATFSLTTMDGHILLPDGTTMYMWSYSRDGEPFQYPGPVLCVNQGDTVTIVLHNTFSENVSIMFPGQDDVMANGAPAQPEFDGGGNLTSLTTSAAPGGTVTYSFVASKPGTFIYESGTDPKKQVNLGLASVLIVRPTMGASFAYNRPDSQFTLEEEFMVFLSEIDPYQHQAAEQGKAYYDANYSIDNFHTHYWLLNGRGFPDSIADNFAAWLPAQPYGSLALITPYDGLVNGVPLSASPIHPLPGLVRYINVGTEDIPFHPHGNNGLVIGRDGNPLETGSGQDLSFEKFAINIGPGQTWDVLVKWYDAEGYDEVTNPVPITIPDVANQTLGMFYSGSPYLGKTGPMPPGVSTLNQCGEYYIISHNHALFQLDAWGMTMAGQITYLRVDPPGHVGCPTP
jgi:FtsP/CotA-like multicopper oxidase with cupredoxin domain